MMPCCRLGFLCVLISVIGCQKPDALSSRSLQQQSSDMSELETSAAQDTASDTNGGTHVISEAQTDSRHETSEEQEITKSDLQSRLKTFKQERNWTFGERSPGQLSGVWEATDGTGHVLRFNIEGRDGTYSCDFNGRRATGLYAVSEDLRIVCLVQSGGVRLGEHYRLQGELIIGPRGPLPKAQWKRVQNND